MSPLVNTCTVRTFSSLLRGALTDQERTYFANEFDLVGFVIHADFGNMRHLLAAFQQQPDLLR